MMTPAAEEMQDDGDSREVKRAETVADKSGGVDVGRWRAVTRPERRQRPPDQK